MTTPPRDEMIPEIIAEFSQVFAAARSRWSRFAEEVHPDLRGPSMMILNTILRHGPITATGLGGMLDMDKATISRQVSRLRELDLVDARAAETDKRVTLLTGSAKAVKAMDQMRLMTADEHLTRFEDWTDDELLQLQSMLQRFNEGAEIKRGHGPANRCAREEQAREESAEPETTDSATA